MADFQFAPNTEYLLQIKFGNTTNQTGSVYFPVYEFTTPKAISYTQSNRVVDSAVISRNSVTSVDVISNTILTQSGSFNQAMIVPSTTSTESSYAYMTQKNESLLSNLSTFKIDSGNGVYNNAASIYYYTFADGIKVAGASWRGGSVIYRYAAQGTKSTNGFDSTLTEGASIVGTFATNTNGNATTFNATYRFRAQDNLHASAVNLNGTAVTQPANLTGTYPISGTTNNGGSVNFLFSTTASLIYIDQDSISYSQTLGSTSGRKWVRLKYSARNTLNYIPLGITGSVAPFFSLNSANAQTTPKPYIFSNPPTATEQAYFVTASGQASGQPTGGSFILTQSYKRVDKSYISLSNLEITISSYGDLINTASVKDYLVPVWKYLNVANENNDVVSNYNGWYLPVKDQNGNFYISASSNTKIHSLFPIISQGGVGNPFPINNSLNTIKKTTGATRNSNNEDITNTYTIDDRIVTSDTYKNGISTKYTFSVYNGSTTSNHVASKILIAFVPIRYVVDSSGNFNAYCYLGKANETTVATTNITKIEGLKIVQQADNSYISNPSINYTAIDNTWRVVGNV